MDATAITTASRELLEARAGRTMLPLLSAGHPDLDEDAAYRISRCNHDALATGACGRPQDRFHQSWHLGRVRGLPADLGVHVRLDGAPAREPAGIGGARRVLPPRADRARDHGPIRPRTRVRGARRDRRCAGLGRPRFRDRRLACAELEVQGRRHGRGLRAARRALHRRTPAGRGGGTRISSRRCRPWRSSFPATARSSIADAAATCWTDRCRRSHT